MKTRKGRLLNRMFAVLLAAVLTAGMVSNAVPASVLAQEESGTESVSGNDAEPTEEEQAKIPEDALAKLAAWAEIAGQVAESGTVMAADDNIASGTDWVLAAPGLPDMQLSA